MAQSPQIEFASCIDRVEDFDGVEKIKSECGFGALFGICAKRWVRGEKICVEYNWAPYRYAGLLRRGFCISPGKLTWWQCRENWGGTGCSGGERELDDVDYGYLLQRITEIGPPKGADGFIRFVRFVDAYLD